MNWENELFNKNENPLDKMVDGYSNTSIFRSIAFIGDSLSSGEFETRDEENKAGYYDMFDYSWGQYIARKNGIKAYNFSRGGMTAKDYVESFAQKNGWWDRDKACQAYVIALGVNDIYNRNMEMGSINDVDKYDYRNNKKTYAGYYGTIISRYKEISPDAKFFFVTFPNSDLPEYKNMVGYEEKTLGMINLLYQLADKFDNSYVIDLYKYGPIHNKKFAERFYLYGHLNPSGYILTARIIDSYIDYIVRHNFKDFKNTGFIGTDIKY